MYMPYLMCGYIVAVLVMLAGCRIARHSVPGLLGVRSMEYSCWCGLVGVVLMAVRPIAPAWATIIAANVSIIAFSFFMYWATAQALRARPRFLPWGAALLGAALVIDTWFTYARPSVMGRILVGSTIPGITAAATAVLLFRNRNSIGTGVSSVALRFDMVAALGLLHSVICVQHAVRCTLTVLFPPTDMLHLDLIQAAFTYSNLILNLTAGCGVIWLALAQHRAELHILADTDGMTGLLNRRAFEELLQRDLRRSHFAGDALVVLMVDIDRFKIVNDAWGHQAGDEVIRRVGRALCHELRPSDAIARFGGEEFAVLVRNLEGVDAEDVAERLRRCIARLTGMPGGGQVTVSVGVAVSALGETPHELLGRCDDALYRSKRNGRNRITISPAPAARLGMPSKR